MTKPLVSVVMPVFNAENYLEVALKSILGQTFTDLEVIAIDDGSTDNSPEILSHYQKLDSRIRLITQSNHGLVDTLNIGFSLANGDFIARMDADDISHPNRLNRQVTYMLQHPAVEICGSWIRTIGGSPDRTIFYKTSHNAIRCEFLFSSAFAHPAVLIRKTLVQSNEFHYDSDYTHCEDYDLWSRLIHEHCGANLPDVLLLYRQSSGQISNRFARQQMEGTKRVQRRLLLELGLAPTEEELQLHHDLSLFKFEATQTFINQVEGWLIKLREANSMSNLYSPSELSQTILFYWYNACKFAVRSSGYWVAPIFLKSSLVSFNSVTRRVDEKLKEKIFTLRKDNYNW